MQSNAPLENAIYIVAASMAQCRSLLHPPSDRPSAPLLHLGDVDRTKHATDVTTFDDDDDDTPVYEI